MALRNETLEKPDTDVLMQQYKLYVEMADQVSQRRMNAGSFFLSANSALLVVLAYFDGKEKLWQMAVCVLGVLISAAWFFTLGSYRRLNAAKYKVIQEMEHSLPAMGYSHEWELLRTDKSLGRYIPLSYVENVIPVVFLIAYILLAVLL